MTDDIPDRVVVFMDYQNVHGWARRQFLDLGADPSDGHVLPLKVGELLVSRRDRDSELMEVRVYRGRPNPERQPGAARANDRQTGMWERSHLVSVIRRNLQYPPDYPASKATEKGIDVAIAVDMIRLGMSGYMDTAILFSSDNDLMPAVEVLWQMAACHVEVAAWAGAARIRFPGTQQPWCHHLNQTDFHAVRDTYDYTQGNHI
ncbi:MAG: NYN domain-containing protein [Propionibacteriaceae bacterium]|nr:NYN domain-containing protein [Propionibacteriaceae bacterium]